MAVDSPEELILNFARGKLVNLVYVDWLCSFYSQYSVIGLFLNFGARILSNPSIQELLKMLGWFVHQRDAWEVPQMFPNKKMPQFMFPMDPSTS